MNSPMFHRFYKDGTLYEHSAIIGTMETLTTPIIDAAVFWLTFICLIAVSLWDGRGRQAKQTTREGRKNDLLCFFGVVAAGLMALILKGLFPSQSLYHSFMPFMLGIILVWVGLLIRHWAVVTLGKYHVMTIYVEPKQPVITTGPYKYIRHPSYLGALVSMLGIALAINSSPGSILLAIVTIVVLALRIRLEDAYLLEHLGSTYGEYAKRTRRLVPFVW